jgi:hypothetical protein
MLVVLTRLEICNVMGELRITTGLAETARASVRAVKNEAGNMMVVWGERVRSKLLSSSQIIQRFYRSFQHRLYMGAIKEGPVDACSTVITRGP